MQENLLKLVADQNREIIDRLDRLERLQSLDLVKENYTTEEVAKRLGKAEWTVRQWCNKGKVDGAYKVHGKGRTGEWRVPHEVLARLLNQGASPPATRTAS